MVKTKKNLHVKPTKEELEQNALKALEEAESLKNEGKNPPDPSKPKENEEKEVVEESEDKKDKKVEKKEPKIDYKRKFIESTREAQILYAKNKKINEAFEKAQEIPEPTEEELKKEYPDWEMMSDLEKRLAKDSYISTQRFKTIAQVTKELKNIEKWQNKVKQFIEDPKTLTKYPELDGREEEFAIFAGKPTRRGVEFEDLVAAFLYKEEKSKPPAKKGKMFETGTGGSHSKPKKTIGKLSIEEARQLRKIDYKKYRKLLKQGKIATEEI